jgi:ribosomal protein S11
MLYEKSYSTNIDLNKFFKDVKLKKQYIKEFKDVVLNLNTIKEKNYRYLNSLLFFKYKSTNTNDNLVTYIIDISFSKTNTLLHIMDFSGNLKFFCSAGLFKYKGRRKKSRFQIIRDFYHILLSKFKFLRFKPIALHLKNVGNDKYWITKKFKKKFYIKTIRNFNLYPCNGCRKKKVRRKKFKKRKRRSG